MNVRTKLLTLYTTPGCHLCEMAEEILYAASAQFQAVDIAEDQALIKRYGVRIPVVADRHGRELGWPFDSTGLRLWLSQAEKPESVMGQGEAEA